MATTATGKKEKFLSLFAQCGNVSKAADGAGIDRKTVYKWRDADAEFAEAFDSARESSADVMEEEARRRAVDGVEKPIYQQGKKVGTVQEYSDTLLIFLLKGARPEKYRERMEHTGPDGGPVKMKLDLL